MDLTVLGGPDGRISPRAGLQLVAKLNEVLGITRTINDGAPPFKQRKRGLMLGGVMVSMAEMMLAGGDFLCDLDHQRKGTAGLGLRAVQDVPASTTVIGLAKRFAAKASAHMERANAKLVKAAFALLSEKRRASLLAQAPTIDLDPTDTEVYGRHKEGSDCNYQGVSRSVGGRSYRRVRARPPRRCFVASSALLRGEDPGRVPSRVVNPRDAPFGRRCSGIPHVFMSSCPGSSPSFSRLTLGEVSRTRSAGSPHCRRQPVRSAPVRRSVATTTSVTASWSMSRQPRCRSSRAHAR